MSTIKEIYSVLALGVALCSTETHVSTHLYNTHVSLVDLVSVIDLWPKLNGAILSLVRWNFRIKSSVISFPILKEKLYVYYFIYWHIISHWCVVCVCVKVQCAYVCVYLSYLITFSFFLPIRLWHSTPFHVVVVVPMFSFRHKVDLMTLLTSVPRCQTVSKQPLSKIGSSL